MGWKSDIASWARQREKDPKIVEDIAVEKGWEPAKYQSSMKGSLHDFLTKWYTLSVKNLPEPATSKRRNPIRQKQQKYTKLSNGWRIWTTKETDGYSTIASNGSRYIEYTNTNSSKMHQQLIKLLKGTNG